MLISISYFVLGLVMLYYGADYLIEYGKKAAFIFNISPLVVGITIVAFGTSLPEMVVSIVANIKGDSGIAIGNIIGSNISNIGLVLGLSAIIKPIQVQYHNSRFDFWFLCSISFLLVIFCKYFVLNRLVGFFFLLCLNFIGHIPYSFSLTSLFIITFFFSFIIYLSFIMQSFYKFGFSYFSIYMPAGAPLILAPLLVPVEIISYLIKPVTLGLRLAANLIAGHLLLSIISYFSYLYITVCNINFFLLSSFFPFYIGLSLLELAVMFIQAYIFVLLLSLYNLESLNLH